MRSFFPSHRWLRDAGACDAGGYYDERKGQVSADDIMEWSRLHMAAYKVPRLVDFTDALPRSGTGKIQWRALQEKEWEGVAKP